MEVAGSGAWRAAKRWGTVRGPEGRECLDQNSLRVNSPLSSEAPDLKNTTVLPLTPSRLVPQSATLTRGTAPLPDGLTGHCLLQNIMQREDVPPALQFRYTVTEETIQNAGPVAVTLADSLDLSSCGRPGADLTARSCPVVTELS